MIRWIARCAALFVAALVLTKLWLMAGWPPLPPIPVAWLEEPLGVTNGEQLADVEYLLCYTFSLLAVLAMAWTWRCVHRRHPRARNRH